MKCRCIVVVFGITLMFVIPLALCLAGGEPKQSAARPVAQQPSIAELVKEIKQLRKRVIELEKRVADLEGHEAEFRADRHGVLHDERGRPVGFWGVDVDGAELQR
ncbi:MAG TPA: hypothetical protein VJ783_17365 [Pirellulales bacterium]|nr:hypothetical protein [Pirellulales bacterium]